MNYVSTRSSATPTSFTETLLDGLAPDGGLYVPEVWPTLSLQELESWKDLPYAAIAGQLFSKFAPDIDQDRLLSLSKATYTPAVFCHARPEENPEKIFPVRPLEDGLHLLQLSNGPTLAFKDAAMQFLGHLLDDTLERQDRTLTILGATSGDTGSAAIHALRGKKRLRIVMLSPADRMSAFQRAQMYTVLDDNVMNIAINGTFDDCQDLVKQLNLDTAFKKKHNLGAINSINWARVAAQSAYYVSAYLQTVKKSGDPVSFCVPSGNFGNAFAALVAKLMGLPIDRIIVATNENDVLHRLLQTGLYAPSPRAQETSSPSMDITKASNFERAVWQASGQNGARTAQIWSRFEKEKSINFAQDYPDVWTGIKALGLSSARSTHADRLHHIKLAKDRWGLYIDPHTADGLKAAMELRHAGETVIVLETAQAVKFHPTIAEALGYEPPTPTGFQDLATLPQCYEKAGKNPESLKVIIDTFLHDSPAG